MSSLAVILTAYGERGAAALPEIAEALRAQTRYPDELFLMLEDVPLEAALEIDWPCGKLWVEDLPTPRDADGRYAVIPYSCKINYALDRTNADYITYLTDDSRPLPEKYERMMAALDEHPDWGVVYCGQHRNGADHDARDIIHDAYCVIDHTQVMHVVTADRWPLEPSHMRLGDAIFWRALHARLGPFYPVPGILDWVQQTPEGISSSW